MARKRQISRSVKKSASKRVRVKTRNSRRARTKTQTTLLERKRAKKINSSFSDNASRVLQKRYLQKRDDGTQEAPADMFARVSRALAGIEKNYNHTPTFIRKKEREFLDVLARKEFAPAGRTMTNAGGETALVANCIVLPVPDTMEGIFQTLKDASLLQQTGSGLGFDFSELRPTMSVTKRSQGVSSGPVSFLKVYNQAFGVIKQQGRHGANMAMMSINHPDVVDFISAKTQEGEIVNFNISVKVTDEFMKRVEKHPDKQWYCTWNGEKQKPQKVLRNANGSVVEVEDMDITAKELFDMLVEHAWLNGEPGIAFEDEWQRTNPLPELGPLRATNPCGEQVLHPYDNCNLGSINLAAFVRARGKTAEFDWARLRTVARIATRMLDNVIDLFDFPVEAVNDMARKNRRVGLGTMGFADALYTLGIPYNSKEGRTMGERMMKTVNAAAHKESERLAKEKGSFPHINLSIYKGKTMRNAALTTVAPTGSISMMFDTSSGIEPNFALSFVKQDKDGQQYHYLNPCFKRAVKRAKLSSYRIKKLKEELTRTGSIQHIDWLPDKLKRVFVTAMDISAEDHMKMQAAFQKHVDNSISKTINFPNQATQEEIAKGFIAAWKLKCKSCTVYRDGSRVVQILNLGTGENIVSPSKLPEKGLDKKQEEKKALARREEAALTGVQLEPKARPEIMHGKTYRLKTGYGKIYITINDDMSGKPFEVFATIGKTGGFYQEQSEGICRLVSLALRSGIKIEEVIENLKGIRGPMPVMTNKGTILSLPDAIGKTIEEHVSGNGFSENNGDETDDELVSVATNAQEVAEALVVQKDIADYGFMPGCPDCSAKLHMSEGCISCSNCGFTRCM